MIFDNDIVQGIIRIVISIAILILIISMYDDPPFVEESKEPVLESAAPEEKIIVQEWYPNMTPDIPFTEEGENRVRPW